MKQDQGGRSQRSSNAEVFFDVVQATQAPQMKTHVHSALDAAEHTRLVGQLPAASLALL
jgi:hypothetical protein